MRALFAVLLLLQGTGAEEASRAAAPEALPSGAGRDLLLLSCVQCHDLRPIASERKTAAAWRRTVNEMIWRGAPLLPGEADTLSAYLAQARPPGGGAIAARAPASARAESADGALRYLPPGQGREIVLRACLGCHDLKTTVAARKTAEGWRRSVDQMVHLGARLLGSEPEVLSEYLAGAFGPDAPVPDALRWAR